MDSSVYLYETKIIICIDYYYILYQLKWEKSKNQAMESRNIWKPEMFADQEWFDLFKIHHFIL